MNVGMLVSLSSGKEVTIVFEHDPVPADGALTWSGAVLQMYITKAGQPSVGPLPVAPGNSYTHRILGKHVKAKATLSISIDFAGAGTGKLTVSQDGGYSYSYQVREDRQFLGGVI